MLSKKHIFCITGVVAVAIRIVFYALFAGTMFRYYHNVPGLDMQTLLRFSEWSAEGVFSPFFTLHRVLIYLVWKLNGGEHAVDMIFLVQSILGIAGALAIADIVLMISGKRKAALAAGLLGALYLPFLIYEFSVLQESVNVNILTIAIWALFKSRQKHFSFGITFSCGILWGLALTGRPLALLLALAAAAGLFTYTRKKQMLKRALPAIAGAAVIIAGASIFNGTHGWNYSPFYNVLPYTVEYNTGKKLEDTAGNKFATYSSMALKMVRRTPLLLSIREIPENHNLYFWREKMPECTMLPGPEILLSLTIFALTVLLLSGKWKKKEGLLLWVLILMAVPLCGREAIGRYRLMLCPAFIALTVIGISAFYRITRWRRTIFSAALLISVIAVIYESNQNWGLRISDFHAWAQATEALYGSSNTETLEAYYDCWKRSFFRNDLAFCSVAAAAMRAQRYDAALQIIKEAELAGEVNRSQIAYFKGLIFVARQDPAGVLREFAPIKPEELPPELQKFYHRIKFDAEKFIKSQKRY